MDPHVEVLRSFYTKIQKVMAHPRSVAAMLYEEGVVAIELVSEVTGHELPSEKKAAIMRAISAAVEGDPKKLWVLITVLENFAESAPVGRKMEDELHSHGLEG